ncbi:hypothetical protein [Burkholderia latens]|uniref:hypothetical protein n=1 Tax=Burkholderia latens TaxID=488446 RepID=UPI001AE15EF1|nr:hypothetical protein [Burkholderia latens]QTO42169.1 hypothetical protein J8I85_08660 [Burkholderia latens]
MGIREEYERRRGEYIEYGRAVAMLAKIERVSFSNAANWLIEQAIHEGIPCYIRAQPRNPESRDSSASEHADVPALNEFVAHTPSNENPAPLSDGPLDILTAIVRGDNLWWDWVGFMQKSIDENQRWKRDEFWAFVMDRGIRVESNAFEDSADCPTFLVDSWEAEAGLSSRESTRFYRGSAAEWRIRASQPAADAARIPTKATIQRRISTVLQKLEQLKFPRRVLEAATSEGGKQYIAGVILASEAISRRASDPWEYKPIAELAEEIFVTESSASWAMSTVRPYSPRDEIALNLESWHVSAMQELVQHADVRIWNELEGLQLYLQVGPGEFRPARAGDSAYDFVCRLRDDGMLLSYSRTFTDLPAWSRELFVHSANWDSFRLVWSSGSSVHDPNQEKFVREKRALVMQETARRMNRAIVSSDSATSTPAFLDPACPVYPQELAIAIAAWEAVTSNGRAAPDGVAAKTAIMSWLSSAYPGLGKEAKERIAVVANWNKRGGATRTPD